MQSSQSNADKRTKYRLKPQGKINGDVVDNGDGVTGADALAIQMMDAKLISQSDFLEHSDSIKASRSNLIIKYAQRFKGRFGVLFVILMIFLRKILAFLPRVL